MQDLSATNSDQKYEKIVLVLEWAAQTPEIRVRLMAHLRENIDRILIRADSGAVQGLDGFRDATDHEMRLVFAEDGVGEVDKPFTIR